MFAIGDTIECVDSIGTNSLVNGLLYKVDDFKANLGIRLNGDPIYYLPSRFKARTNSSNIKSFNVGDRVCFIGAAGLGYMHGDHGTIQDTSPDGKMVCIDLDIGIRIACTTNLAQLVVNKPKSDFVQYEALVLTKLPNGHGTVGRYRHILGHKYMAMKTSDNSLWAYAEGLEADSALMLIGSSGKSCWYECFSLADSYTKAIASPCTCDSMELFRKGCTCGHVKKQKWGLQA